MAIAYYATFPPSDRPMSEIANQVIERIGRELDGKAPEGAIFHAEGPLPDGGWWTFDEWESDEAFAAFRQQILMPALQDAGVSRPNVQRLDVHWDSSQMGPS